jgi:hypothetical protein
VVRLVCLLARVNGADNDLASDYNYIRDGDVCVPVGPEPIPAGVCVDDRDKTYMGSSGYRRIPGNTCDRERGLKKDEPVEKPCSQGACFFVCRITRHRSSLG